jgi:hypothetical protein
VASPGNRIWQPNVKIAQQLYADVNPTRDEMFYRRVRVLDGGPFPEPVEIRGRATNRGDLEEADIVVTNIQQLQGEENRWLQALPPDFFDLILFDEAHHNVAESWEVLRRSFPNARIVNYSATPTRADGRLMAGRFVYAYPVGRFPAPPGGWSWRETCQNEQGRAVIPDWTLRVALAIVGILGGAVWYFLARRHPQYALWVGFGDAVLLLLVVALYINNDLVRRDAPADQAPAHDTFVRVTAPETQIPDGEGGFYILLPAVHVTNRESVPNVIEINLSIQRTEGSGSVTSKIVGG